MNTTEIDTEIGIEEDTIREIVTNDLSGEKIERLLDRAGFDCEHKVGDEGVTVLEVRGETVTIIVSETWEADGEWYIDPNSVVLDKFVNGSGVDTLFPSVSSEAQLVETIEEFADEA